MKYVTYSGLLRIVAIVMLLAAVFQDYKIYYLSYDYFVILRWILCFVGTYLGYVAFTTKNAVWVFLAVLVVVFFNPIFPLPISKQTWKILDAIFASIMAISIFLVGEKIRPVE